MNVNERLELEIKLVQEMFSGERWNAQITTTQRSGTMVVLMGADNVDEVLLGLAAFAAQWAEADPVEMACLTVDMYCLTARIGDPFPDLVPGELQARFLAGDRTVREAMNIMVVSPSTEACAHLPYTRVDDGIKWQPMVRDGSSEGRVVNAMRAALR